MPRNIAIDDFMKIRLVSDPQIAPDGSRVACVVKHTDAEKNRYVSEIWIVPTDGEACCFTSAESSASHPRWSPDGSQLAFLSDRQKPFSQIYVMPARGGEARALTTLKTEGSISAFRWSPDGSRIAFVFRATPEPYRQEPAEARKKKGSSSPIRHHTRLFYRMDGMGYVDGEYSQVWLADANTGACRQLTFGPYDCDSLTWSPDSQTLAFLSDRRDDWDIAPAHTAIYTIKTNTIQIDSQPATAETATSPPLDRIPNGTHTSLGEGSTSSQPAAEGEVEITLIPSPPGSKGALAWSPDGRQFAYVGNPDPLDTWGTTNDRVFLLPATGNGIARDLTGHTDFAVGHLTLSDSHETGAGDLAQWSPDGASIYFAASVRGDTRLCRVDVENAGVVSLTDDGEMGSFHARDKIVFTLGNTTLPHELVEGKEYHSRTVLTHFNDAWLDEIHFASAEPLDVDNKSGGKVPGWLLKPTDFAEGEKYPLIVYVHGGPHAQYGNTLFHELQWLAAEGYVVLYPNPRGSKGYGEAHTKAIIGNWGSLDFDDVMTITDYACSLDYVDADRTAIMGGSYGGYMTAWAIGHTDRFRCAIADRLVADLPSMSGTCDFTWKPDAYYKGNAWSEPAHLWRCSPLAYAGNITTPLLLIHSDGDLRCPAGQAEELFSALRLQRKIVEYRRYPAEASHGLSRNGPPDLRLDRLQSNLDWLNRWLKPTQEV